MIVSLDGATQESYAQYRVGGKLEKVIEGTKNLLRERRLRKQRTPNVAIQFLVMKHNENEIEQIRSIAQDVGADKLLIKNIEVHSVQEAEVWLPQDHTFRRYDFDGTTLTVKSSQKESCPRPWLSTLINWDGSFVPCCFDKNGQFPMGNINQPGDLSDIWLGTDFKSFRKQLLMDRKAIDICRNCNQGFGSFLPGRRWKKEKK